MPENAGILLALAVAGGIGYSLHTLLVGGGKTDSSRWAFYVPLGFGYISVGMFCLGAFGRGLVTWAVWFFAVVSLIVLVVVVVAARARIGTPSTASDTSVSKGRPTFSLLEKYLLILIVLVVGVSVIQAHYWPVHNHDSIASFDIRARASVAEGTVATSLYNDAPSGANRYYPPLVPLSYAFLYFFGVAHPKVMLSVFFLSALWALYVTCRRQASRCTCLFLLVFLVGTPQVFRWSYTSHTSFIAAVLLVLGLISLCAWEQGRGAGHLRLASLCLAFACWTRPESAAFCAATAVPVAAVLIRRKQMSRIVPYAVPAAVLSALWLVYASRVLGFPGYAAESFTWDWGRAGSALAGVLWVVFAVRWLGLLPHLLVVGLLMGWRNWRESTFAWALVAASFAALLSTLYVALPTGVPVLIITVSGSRACLPIVFFLPVVIAGHRPLDRAVRRLNRWVEGLAERNPLGTAQPVGWRSPP